LSKRTFEQVGSEEENKKKQKINESIEKLFLFSDEIHVDKSTSEILENSCHTAKFEIKIGNEENEMFIRRKENKIHHLEAYIREKDEKMVKGNIFRIEMLSPSKPLMYIPKNGELIQCEINYEAKEKSKIESFDKVFKTLRFNLNFALDSSKNSFFFSLKEKEENNHILFFSIQKITYNDTILFALKRIDYFFQEL
jgi:hypothetical protein